MSRELQPGEYKSYVAYKGKDQEPKKTEFGLGYFEDEIGWYFISGELTLDIVKAPDNIRRSENLEYTPEDPYSVNFDRELGIRVTNPLVNPSR